MLAIEGNHDNRPYGTKTSWLRYLASWGLLILLEPGDTAAGEPFYFPWDGQRGGYIDLDCGVRVLGSYWYGSTAPKAIEQIAEAIGTATHALSQYFNVPSWHGRTDFSLSGSFALRRCAHR